MPTQHFIPTPFIGTDEISRCTRYVLRNSLQVKGLWGTGTMLDRKNADDMCWGKSWQNFARLETSPRKSLDSLAQQRVWLHHHQY